MSEDTRFSIEFQRYKVRKKQSNIKQTYIHSLMSCMMRFAILSAVVSKLLSA